MLVAKGRALVAEILRQKRRGGGPDIGAERREGVKSACEYRENKTSAAKAVLILRHLRHDCPSTLLRTRSRALTKILRFHTNPEDPPLRERLRSQNKQKSLRIRFLFLRLLVGLGALWRLLLRKSRPALCWYRGRRCRCLGRWCLWERCSLAAIRGRGALI